MLFVALLERQGEGSRARILATLRRNPGLNATRLARAVGLSWTTTMYHLKRLRAQGAIELQRHGRRDIRCFPVGVPAKYRSWLAALHNEKDAEVLDALGPGEAGVRELSQRMGLSESAMRRRLERLREDGVLEKRGKLRPVYLRNPAPAHSDDGGERQETPPDSR
jgi:DNA-binding transcriptional ArsR family regulator